MLLPQAVMQSAGQLLLFSPLSQYLLPHRLMQTPAASPLPTALVSVLDNVVAATCLPLQMPK